MNLNHNAELYHKISHHKNELYIGIQTSNVGCRMTNIYNALTLLKQNSIELVTTSFLYKSLPLLSASHQQQQHEIPQEKRSLHEDYFLSCVIKCCIPVEWTPFDCLSTLKKIEIELLSNSSNDPREAENDVKSQLIDLDILLYEDESFVVKHETLCIPHEQMHKREYVLRALMDIFEYASAGNDTRSRIHPKFGISLEQFYSKLKNTQHVRQILPIPIKNAQITNSYLLIDINETNSTSLIWGILNCTPDSFFDGGKYNRLEAAIERVEEMRTCGVDIIDVGGQSTRHNAVIVNSDEEWSRVEETIGAIKKQFPTIPISIDTFRWDVAEKALNSGVSIINDVRAGTYSDSGEHDENESMLRLVAKVQNVPVVLMHSRGNPSTMISLNQYSSSILHDLRVYLRDRINVAMKLGCYKWNIILDPGIGFAKEQADVLKLLKELLMSSCGNCCQIIEGFPTLIGHSRKRFTGAICDGDSLTGTLVVSSLLMERGVFGVRVHDVEENNKCRNMIEEIKSSF